MQDDGNRALSGVKTVCVLLTTVAIAGCQLQSAPNETPQVLNADVTGPMKAPGFDGEKTVSPNLAARDIERREAEYKKVLQEARMRGLVGGVLQGAIIGLLIDSSGTGALAGAVLGGAVGTAVGSSIGTNIIQKHKNFLVRDASLQRVIRAARQDTANTNFDLLLSDELIAAGRASGTPDRGELVQAERRLQDFREIAVTRAVSLRELLPLYNDNPEAKVLLVGELEAQTAMIAQFDQNIAILGNEVQQ